MSKWDLITIPITSRKRVVSSQNAELKALEERLRATEQRLRVKQSYSSSTYIRVGSEKLQGTWRIEIVSRYHSRVHSSTRPRNIPHPPNRNHLEKRTLHIGQAPCQVHCQNRRGRPRVATIFLSKVTLVLSGRTKLRLRTLISFEAASFPRIFAIMPCAITLLLLGTFFAISFICYLRVLSPNAIAAPSRLLD